MVSEHHEIKSDLIGSETKVEIRDSLERTKKTDETILFTRELITFLIDKINFLKKIDSNLHSVSNRDTNKTH